ncbi:adenosylhomocysteinase [Pseudooctadecabacter jejudonensis]|uniref:Adenosylhomocysteinase n=1 Tax=Pseudooctadecabacter jejudonensis TaxID=1391910 RepID=A0A1Y5RXB0_9RHOB|nr:adenosylhomocysteinase [Pseudooctadecabacter jejudonensis]SLN27110.1 Adenosylhomocysteinase [Pseudooctadecabacter jejudonensis]
MDQNTPHPTDHNGPDIQALVDEGRNRIDWVHRYSPVMNGLVRRTVGDGSLAGKRIAVVVHLEAKTAYLAQVLADAGADVIAAGSNPFTTNASVVAALRDKGIRVVSEAGGTHATWEEELRAAADLEPDYIIDDGAELTMRVGIHRPDVFKRLKGVSEETTTGTARLHAMAAAGKLPFPALTANDARCKHLFDNRYGTGQTTVQAMLMLTNRQAAGAVCVIVGYGYVGRGIAEYLSKLRAKVRVVEVDPVRALEAHIDGHVVGTAADVLPDADFVITATGGMRAVTTPEFNALPDGAILCNAGHHDLEVDVEALATMAQRTTQGATDMVTYHLPDKDLHVLSNGALVNIAGGSGHPVEIMDLTFAVQGLGAHYLVNTPMDPGVHVLPRAVDDSIAAAKLDSLGVTLDAPRSEQTDNHADFIDRITL